MFKSVFIAIFLVITLKSVLSEKEHNHAVLSCGPRGDSSTCSVYNITPITAPNKPIRILGQTRGFKDLSVTSLVFKAPNVLNYVPSNAIHYFPNVDYIELNNVSLANLNTDAFVSCDKLATIVVTNNKFEHIPAGFARKCRAVSNVTMTHNGIKTIDEKALESLSRLMVLDLSDNELTCIPPTLFTAHTPEIYGILLRSNKITAIGSETFRHLQSLIKIDLVSNAIAFIPTMDFEGTAINGALDFDVSDNPIAAIQPDFLEEFFAQRDTDEEPGSSVTLLMSSANQSCVGRTDMVLQSVNYETVSQVLKPCYDKWSLELSQTKVECKNATPIESNEQNEHDQVGSDEIEITQSIELQPTVEINTKPKKSIQKVPQIAASVSVCSTDKACRFYVDYKRRYTCVIDDVDSVLTSLGGTHVTDFKDDDVTRVYFTNSSLRNIPLVVFSRFKNLNFLSVANCSLGIITKATLKACNGLVYLDVSHNEIIHVSKNAFDKCETLQVIDMTGNPIDRIDQNYKTFIMDNNTPPEAS